MKVGDGVTKVEDLPFSLVNGELLEGNGQSHQQLVTDEDGQVKWEEKAFWKESRIVSIYPEMTIQPEIEEQVSTYIFTDKYANYPQKDAFYTVSYNGREYQCVGKECFLESVPIICLGNSGALGQFLGFDGGPITEDPFGILFVSEDLIEMFGGSAFALFFEQLHSTNIQIYGEITQTKKIPNEFIEHLNDNILNGPIVGSLYGSLNANNKDKLGAGAVSFGANNIASGPFSFAAGSSNIASGVYAASFGYYNEASANAALALGGNTKAFGDQSLASGNDNIAYGSDSHAEGTDVTAIEQGTHAEGHNTAANEMYSHSEGSYTLAYGAFSHAQGQGTLAYGMNSYSEGNGDRNEFDVFLISEDNKHIFGIKDYLYNNFLEKLKEAIKYGRAYAIYSICDEKSQRYAAGVTKIVNCDESTITFEDKIEPRTSNDNIQITALYGSASRGTNSHTEGYNSVAIGENQHVQGKNNLEYSSYAHIVGNGSDSLSRSNAHTLDWNGNAKFAGDLYVRGTGTKNLVDAKKVATEEYVDTSLTSAIMTNETIDAICDAVIYAASEVNL